MASGDATPFPKKNVAYRVTFPIFDNDGDLVTGAAALDSEVSLDGGTFSDVTAEATEIATNSGMYFLDLTAAEMNADTVAIIIKTTTTDAKTTPIILYPEEAGDIRVNVTEIGGTTVSLTGGDLDVNVAAVASNAINAAAIATDAITNAKIAANAIGASEIATDAITAAKIAANAIGASELAAGAITSATFAVSAIDAAVIAADAVTEIRSLVSGTADSGTTTTLVDAARTEADTDYWKGMYLLITSGTAINQVRLITAFNAATDTMTVAPAFTQAIATNTYEVLPAGAIISVQGDVTGNVDGNVSGNVTGSVGSLVGHTVQTGDNFARLGAPVGADVSADIAAVKAETVLVVADTNELQTDNVPGLIAALNDPTVTSIRSLVSGTADSGSTTTLVDAVRTEADTDYWKGMYLLITSGTAVNQVRLIIGFNAATDTITVSPAFTQAIVTNTYEILPAGAVDVRLLNGSAPNNLVSGRIDSSVGAVAANAIDAAAIANGAIDAATFAAGAIDAAAIATDAITSAKIAADAIGASELATDAVNEIRDSILSDGTTFAGANINATISSRATPANVNTEVLDVMQTDTFAQVGQEAPAATQSILKMLQFMYKAWRNKSDQTSSTYRVFSDDGITVDQKATVSDDATTFVSEEVGTGP